MEVEDALYVVFVREANSSNRKSCELKIVIFYVCTGLLLNQTYHILYSRDLFLLL